MTRLRRLWLVIPIALGIAGCIVIVRPTPAAPTALIPTSTPPPTLTSAAPFTPIGITTVTPQPGSTTAGPATETPVPTLPATLEPSPPGSGTPGARRPISITTFTVSPPEIRPGDPVTLTWEVVAEQVTLWRLDGLGRLSESYTVPLTGTLVVSTPVGLRNRVTFALFALSGGSSAQATVSALITCPDVWFFPNPPSLCPASPPNYTTMQVEHFERGLMFWTEWNDAIYILYSDGLFQPAWQGKPNAWFPGMPLNDPNIVPPAGVFQPVRGFGMVWRDETVFWLLAGRGWRIRDRLGWATDEEFGVNSAAFQCDTAPKYGNCYISGPGGAVYALGPEGSRWFEWTGPTPTPNP